MADTPLQAAPQEARVPEVPSVAEVLQDLAKTSILKVQNYSILSLHAITNLASGPRYIQDTLQQMDDIGVGSLPIVLLSGFFIGAVMVLQTGTQFERFGQASLTGVQGYCSAKHALLGLTRQLAHELGPHGIRVNSVAPGFVRTNPATERQWASYGSEMQRQLVEGIALKRLGTADEIAKAVMFFASDLASFVNGHVLAVDGGK